jgi:hypothetical protein
MRNLSLKMVWDDIYKRAMIQFGYSLAIQRTLGHIHWGRYLASQRPQIA